MNIDQKYIIKQIILMYNRQKFFTKMKSNGTVGSKKYRNKRRSHNSMSLKQRYDYVIEKCTHFLAKKLTVNNCIDTILFANIHQMSQLSLLSASFIDNNFEMVFTSDEFIEMEPRHLFILLPLLIYDEMAKADMKNSILFWSKYKRTERKKYIGDLLM